MAIKVVKPKHLSNEAGQIYCKTVADVGIKDALGLALLLTGCEAWDRMREAQAIIRKQGLTIRDRNGIPRPHPATVIERNSRSAFHAVFTRLDIEPPKVAT